MKIRVKHGAETLVETHIYKDCFEILSLSRYDCQSFQPILEMRRSSQRLVKMWERSILWNLQLNIPFHHQLHFDSRLCFRNWVVEELKLPKIPKTIAIDHRDEQANAIPCEIRQPFGFNLFVMRVSNLHKFICCNRKYNLNCINLGSAT